VSTPRTPRALGGYGPAVLVGLALALVSIYVPSVSTERVSTAADPDIGQSALARGNGRAAVASETTIALDGPTGVAGSTGPSGTSGLDPTVAGPGGAARTGSQGAPGVAPGTVKSCGDVQVKGDPYSPPCYLWGGGDNGGATARGVTADTITITIRDGTFDKGVIDAMSRAAMRNGASNYLAGETPELIKETFRGLVDYFNANYQFYGRKLDLQFFNGKGELIEEVLGGSQERAQADAITVANEIKAFADLSGVSPPYADALARQKVIAVGAPYMSKSWFQARRPYEWSWFADCNTLVDMSTSYYIARLAGRPANLAGGALKGQPRRMALVAPDSDWFQDCVAAGPERVRAAGFAGEAQDDAFTYRLDINAMAPQAYSIIPQLVSRKVTTVVCACDPLMLMFLTGKAREQGYQPEWVSTGLAFVDQDPVAQLFEQSNWDGAFGISFAGAPPAANSGPGARAFASTRPGKVPSKTVEALFHQLQVFAVGVQMAGPKLTPETFEAGMFKYPTRSGPAGTWTFGSGDYTATGDAREVYYSASTPSTQAGGRGSWIDPSGGRSRYLPGQFPTGDPVNGT